MASPSEMIHYRKQGREIQKGRKGKKERQRVVPVTSEGEMFHPK